MNSCIHLSKIFRITAVYSIENRIVFLCKWEESCIKNSNVWSNSPPFFLILIFKYKILIQNKLIVNFKSMIFAHILLFKECILSWIFLLNFWKSLIILPFSLWHTQTHFLIQLIEILTLSYSMKFVMFCNILVY